MTKSIRSIPCAVSFPFFLLRSRSLSLSRRRPPLTGDQPQPRRQPHARSSLASPSPSSTFSPLIPYPHRSPVLQSPPDASPSAPCRPASMCSSPTSYDPVIRSPTCSSPPTGCFWPVHRVPVSRTAPSSLTTLRALETSTAPHASTL
jgi:hypothetical protein